MGLLPVLGFLLLLWSPGTRAAELQQLVEAWAESEVLDGVQVGVSVVDAEDGRALAGHGDEEVMNPASGAKLFTTAAALRLLPADTRWTTTVRGRRVGETLDGPLWLVGGGDPKLLPGHIGELAEQVAEAGVKPVTGGVVVEASLFDGATLPPAYDQKDSDAGYRAAIGAAGCNFGAVRVTLRPGAKPGAPVRVWSQPRTDAVVFANEARTVAGKGSTLAVAGEALPDGRTRFRVSGRLGVGSAGASVRKRVTDPDLLSGYLLVAALRKAGVEVTGEVRVNRAPIEAPEDVLARVESQSLADTLADINTWSNNYMAETLFKLLARTRASGPAEWGRSREAVTSALVELGLEPERFRIVNGSGLYRATRAAPREITRLLHRMARDGDERAAAFRDSLAVAGAEGTLKHRLRDPSTVGKVCGKTGTLDEVVSLSGYIPTASGRELAFSIIVNDATSDRTRALRQAIDRLVLKLAAQ